MPKMTQPNLDYIGKNVKIFRSFFHLLFSFFFFFAFVTRLHATAPEVQQKKVGGFYSDMYSFGMTICAIFNQGRPLIQGNHSCSEYLKQLENVSNSFYVVQCSRIISCYLLAIIARVSNSFLIYLTIYFLVRRFLFHCHS